MNPVRSVALLLALAASVASAQTPTYFSVTAGAHPHDVAATREPGGPVYYTAQMTGKLGILDPATGKVDEVPLGRNSAPHGVVVGPDGAPWITDGGQNAIVRVDPKTHAGHRVEAAGVGAQRQLEHADIRSPGQGVVHGAKRLLRPRRSRDGRRSCLACAPGHRTVWNHDDAVRRHLLRIARRQSHRPHRRRDGRSDRNRAATPQPGCATRVVRLEGQRVGQLLEHGTGRPLRSGNEDVARVEAARRCPHVLGLGRS
jgi:hypothetical protein